MTQDEMQEKREKHTKIIDAETRASMYLADANQASELGDNELAEQLYAKSQYWLDRYNKLSGNH